MQYGDGGRNFSTTEGRSTDAGKVSCAGRAINLEYQAKSDESSDRGTFTVTGELT